MGISQLEVSQWVVTCPLYVFKKGGLCNPFCS